MRKLRKYSLATFCVVVVVMLSMPNQANAVNDKYDRVAYIGTPVVDGDLSDDVWLTADWQEMDIYAGGTKPNGFKAKSAVLWDDDHLYTAIEVEDETHAVPKGVVPAADSLWNGDSPQHRVDLEYDSIANSGDDIELGYALQDGKILTHAWASPTNIEFVKVEIVRDEAKKMTYYEVAVTLSLHTPNDTLSEYVNEEPDAKIGYSDMVNANDGADRLGWLEWSSGIGQGKNADQFGTLTFDHTPQAVGPVGKLTSTWGGLKQAR